MAEKTGFFAELKRRHVWRVAVAYAIVGWILVQIATQVFPAFHMPGWSDEIVVILVVLGFPVVVALAWAFEITPQGIRHTEPAQSPEARDAGETRLIARRLNTITLVALVIAVGFLVWRLYAVRHAPASAPVAKTTPTAAAVPAAPAAATPPVAAAPAPAAPSISPKSIAVLPFENLSTDKANAYFADGMQDLILSKLADIGDLKVISRTSTMKYKSRPDDLKIIARQLGVATILEGSVQKAGKQVLINVQLINATTDTHLWAATYRRTLNDIFGVEGEVAGKIATALNAKLSPVQSARLTVAPTTNEAAYDLFLRAEYTWNRANDAYSQVNLKAAIPLYQRAVKNDPGFAMAWARLSLAQSFLSWFVGGGMNVNELAHQAQANAEQALRLQPGLAAAYVALGYHDYMANGDRTGALKAFAAALVSRPHDVDALTGRGMAERRAGRFDDARASLQQAVALDPRNVILTGEVGATQMMLGRYADAETWFRRALALDPDDVGDQVSYGISILLDTGDVRRALQAVQGDAPLLKIERAKLLTLQRKYREALQLLDGTPDLPASLDPSNTVPKVLLQANLYRLLGDAARARPLFEQGLAAARAQLAIGHGVNLAFVWRNRADAELGLGQTRQGMNDIAGALTIIDQNGDQFYGPLVEYACAELYAQAGRADLAAPLLAKALPRPGSHFLYAPVLLWLDPAWDPIRTDAGFEALLKQYANDKPAVVYAAPKVSGAPAR